VDFFEFKPRFKLLIVGNHKPRLRTVDEAIRRRLHLIPFAVTIPADKVDLHFAERLKPEWPAILQWMIAGCLNWQKQGLNPPAAVKDATVDYLAAQDAVGLWLEERCKETTTGFASHAELFKSWSAWATDAGEFVGSQRGLIENLEGRGFVKERHGKGRTKGFRGLFVMPMATMGTES